MKLTLASLTALVFAGALALPAFAQTGSMSDNPSGSSASSSASTSETKNGETTTRQNSAHQKTSTDPSGSTYSEHSNQQYEGKSSSMMGAPATPGESSTMPGSPSENTNNPPTQ